MLRAGRSGWRLLSCPASEHCEFSPAGPLSLQPRLWFLLAKPQNSTLQNGCLPLGSAPQADNNGAPAAADAGGRSGGKSCTDKGAATAGVGVGRRPGGLGGRE